MNPTVQQVQYLQESETSDDPFDLDLPEYEQRDAGDPFEDFDSEEAEEMPEEETPVEDAANEDNFEDVFDAPEEDSPKQDAPAEEPVGPETIPVPEAELIEPEETEVDRTLREAQEGFEKETMKEEAERSPSDLLKQFEEESNADYFDAPEEEPSDAQEFTQEELNERRRALAKAREENDKSCAEEFEKLRSDGIRNIDLSIRVEGEAGQDYPFECGFGNEMLTPRQWPQITYMWKASGLCHKPLYFEQVQLERYGHSWGPYVQPIMSGAHFFGSVAILPYKMGIRTPNECVYTLGYYRPGSCAPYMIEAVPFTWRAAFFQGMTAAGAAVVIP